MNNPPYYLTAYGLAKKHGFQGTEEEWVKSLQADQIQLRFHDNLLQWKYTEDDDSKWDTLVNLSMLEGYVTRTNDNAQKAELARQEIAYLMGLFDEELEELKCVVNVTRDTSGNFASDRTWADIRTVWEQGQKCVCHWGDTRLPLVSMTDGVAHFSAVVDGQEYRVEISANGVTAVCENLGQDAFVVTVSATANRYVSDKGFREIWDAWEQSRHCVCSWDGCLLPLVQMDSASACFVAVWGEHEHRVIIYASGAVAVESVKLGTGVFTVTYTGNEDEYHRIDKTFDEIRAAVDSGKVVQCLAYGSIIPLAQDNGNALVFIRTDAALVTTVVVSDDGTAQDTYSESLRHTRYFHLCYFGDDDGWHADDFWNRDLSEYFGGDALITPTCILHDMGPDSDGTTEIHLPLESVNHNANTFIFRGTFSNPSKTYCCTARLTIEDINDEWGVPAVEVTVEDVDSGSYTLPVATLETLGGVQPVTKTANMTQPVGVDANGGLWTEPSGEGGGNDGGTVSEESWQHLDTFDLSSGAVSYEIDTTGHNEIMLLVTTGLDASGCTFSWKQFPPTTPGPNVTLAKVLGGMTQLSYLGDGLVVVHKPRSDSDTLRQTYLVTGVADSNNTLNLKFATATSGVINVYGR